MDSSPAGFGRKRSVACATGSPPARHAVSHAELAVENHDRPGNRMLDPGCRYSEGFGTEMSTLNFQSLGSMSDSSRSENKVAFPIRRLGSVASAATLILLTVHAAFAAANLDRGLWVGQVTLSFVNEV